MNPECLRRHLEKLLPRYKLPVDYLPWPSDVPEAGIKINRRFFQEQAGGRRSHS